MDLKSNTLTVEQARTRSFYVLNTGGTSRYQLRGNVIIPYEGGESRIVFPYTWLPQPVDAWQAKMLVHNPDFIRAVENGILTLVTSELAEHLLSISSGVEEEKQRLLSLQK
jgi:hypothetical protein